MYGVAYAELCNTYLLMNSPSWIFSGSWWSFVRICEGDGSCCRRSSICILPMDPASVQELHVHNLNNIVQLVCNLHMVFWVGKAWVSILPHSYSTIRSNEGYSTGLIQQNLIIHAGNVDPRGEIPVHINSSVSKVAEWGGAWVVTILATSDCALHLPPPPPTQTHTHTLLACMLKLLEL